MKILRMLCLFWVSTAPAVAQAFDVDTALDGSWSAGNLMEQIDEIIVTAPWLEGHEALWQLNELEWTAPWLFNPLDTLPLTPELVPEPPQDDAALAEACALLIDQWKNDCQRFYRALTPYCTGGLFLFAKGLLTLNPTFRLAWELVPADVMLTALVAGQCNSIAQALEERCQTIADDPVRGPRAAGCEAPA